MVFRVYITISPFLSLSHFVCLQLFLFSLAELSTLLDRFLVGRPVLFRGFLCIRGGKRCHWAIKLSFRPNRTRIDLRFTFLSVHISIEASVASMTHQFLVDRTEILGHYISHPWFSGTFSRQNFILKHKNQSHLRISPLGLRLSGTAVVSMISLRFSFLAVDFALWRFFCFSTWLLSIPLQNLYVYSAPLVLIK